MEYINPSEMKVIDTNSIYFGVGIDRLMDNAGRVVYEELKKIKGFKKKKITIICGNGNNGGDGFVAANYLHDEGLPIKVYLAGFKV